MITGLCLYALRMLTGGHEIQVISSGHLDEAALIEAGWKDADAVVFGPDPSLLDSVYDAQLVADMMVLQQLYATASCNQRMHFVAPARDPFTAPVVNHVLLDFGAAQQRLSKVDPVTRQSHLSQALTSYIGNGCGTKAGVVCKRIEPWDFL
jgi:hypothetical protein